MIRKFAVSLALAAGLLTAGSAAEARDGCGLGYHRGPYGWCRPNLGYQPYASTRPTTTGSGICVPGCSTGLGGNGRPT